MCPILTIPSCSSVFTAIHSVGVVISFHVDSMLLHSADQFQTVTNASIQGGGDYILHTVDVSTW